MRNLLPWSVYILDSERAVQEFRGPSFPLPPRETIAAFLPSEALPVRCFVFESNKGQPHHFIAVKGVDEICACGRPLLYPEESFGNLAGAYNLLRRGRDATVFTDVQACLLAASPAWLAIYDYRLRDVLGENPRVINARKHSAAFFRGMWQALTDPAVGTWTAELENRRRNGEIVPVWQTIVTVRGASQRIDGYLGTTRDMTAHRELRDYLVSQNTELTRLNSLKGQLLALAAHDLKSPLFAMGGYTDILRSQGVTPSIVERMESLEQSMMRLVQNVMDLQNLSEGEAGIEISRFNPRASLRSIVAIQAGNARARCIHLEFDAPDLIPPIFADRARFERAIANLVDYALKIAPRESGVTIACKLTTNGKLIVRVGYHGVADAAADMLLTKPWQQASLDEFRRAAGTGWGLAVAREIIEFSGGRIDRSTSDDVTELVTSWPLGYEHHATKPWSFLCIERWTAPLPDQAEQFDSVGQPPIFLCSDVNEARRIAHIEYPSIIVAPRRFALCDELRRFPAPDGTRLLAPAWLDRDPSGHLIDVAGDSTLLNAAREILENQLSNAVQ